VKLRKRTLLIGFALLLAATLSVVFYSSLQPTWEGKPVGYWITQLGEAAPQSGEARLALDKLGPDKTAPYLAKAIGQKPQRENFWRKSYRRNYDKLPAFLKKRLQPPTVTRPSRIQYTRSRIAYYLQALGRNQPAAAAAAVPGLASLLDDSDSDVRFCAGLALMGFGTNATLAVPAISKLLETHPEKVNDPMMQMLGSCGPVAKATIPTLIKCLESTNVHLRMNCAKTLWQLDHSHSEVVRPVVRELSSGQDTGVRIEAASLLWAMDKDPAVVVPTLISLLKDDDEAYDFRTIRLLQQIGPGAKEAIPTLSDWLQRNPGAEAFVTNAAYDALKRMAYIPPTE